MDILLELARLDSGLSLTVISNSYDFSERYGNDAWVNIVFRPKSLYFPRYDYDELREILKYRAEEAFQPGVVEDDVVDYCAELAIVEEGALFGMRLLRRVGELVAARGENKVTREHVNQAWKELIKAKREELPGR